MPLKTRNVSLDGEPLYFNNKETGIAHDGHQLLMLHYFVHYEAVFNTRKTVLCILITFLWDVKYQFWIAKRMHHLYLSYIGKS